LPGICEKVVRRNFSNKMWQKQDLNALKTVIWW
jgi:hypothetical protein